MIDVIPDAGFKYGQHLWRKAPAKTVRRESAEGHSGKPGQGADQQEAAIHPVTGHLIIEPADRMTRRSREC